MRASIVHFLGYAYYSVKEIWLYALFTSIAPPRKGNLNNHILQITFHYSFQCHRVWNKLQLKTHTNNKLPSTISWTNLLPTAVQFFSGTVKVLPSSNVDVGLTLTRFLNVPPTAIQKLLTVLKKDPRPPHSVVTQRTWNVNSIIYHFNQVATLTVFVS